MSVVVPGKGWATVVDTSGVGLAYGVLGPLAPGDFIRRLTYIFTADGTGSFGFSAVLGSVDEGSLVAIQAGAPLIQRSTATYFSQPGILVHTVAGVASVGWVPVGVRGEVGSRYVIFGLSAKTAGVDLSALVGLSVLRLVVPRELEAGAPVG